jgi:anti-sigma regulatory factor (Ser/Thr protein kinase)
MISIAVTEASQVADARRQTVELAKRNGFDDEDAGRVAITTTELATNLVKHGRGGQIISAAFDDITGGTGIELIALDKGEGIADIAIALEDGVSGAGTAGNGLGAIRRQSREFEIFSTRGQGTAVIARLMPREWRSSKKRPPEVSWAGLSVPMPGESACGDTWAIRSDENDGSRTILVVDGLGHGPEAAKVAADATRLFDRYWRAGPAEMMRSLHAGLRGTRGGAVAIARIEPQQRRIRYVGVGNIAAALVTPNGETKRLMSYNGTVGHNARQIQELVYPMESANGQILVMQSDGVSTSWSLPAYPGLISRHPLLIASVLYRDFARGRDDATVVVAKVGE